MTQIQSECRTEEIAKQAVLDLCFERVRQQLPNKSHELQNLGEPKIVVFDEGTNTFTLTFETVTFEIKVSVKETIATWINVSWKGYGSIAQYIIDRVQYQDMAL
ncbi:hypothetical protein COY32_05310 [candidate division WWE3 bacterium CG_4_10_14_0_2_um_filter_41_14]|uniref:Uncharacterized protein n=1 Tax=candidate division WWE3 bacterium CG_4_10_14_0_2_um_filter_41_14 TaxID=1975072 RepID=A0A2M7TGW7_UNCKA|nr:MAG: hypothetical protein COY32_05310 [candidate division WWE3 bacterium CG_4_10_14_0_2_um_filter_41_14]